MHKCSQIATSKEPIMHCKFTQATKFKCSFTCWESEIDFVALSGLTCIKTHKTYKTRSLSLRDDQKHDTTGDSLNDLSGANTADSKAHLHKRRSVLKETSTSRYRSFVEKNIRQIGLNGLSQRIKVALHKTLWKARQALEVLALNHHFLSPINWLSKFLSTSSE